MNSVEIIGNLVRVEFTSSILPVFIEKKNKEHIFFGENDNYFSFLIDLYRRHPAHNAIIKAKAKYIYGKGLSIKQGNTLELAKAQSFLSQANRYEDWNAVFEKTCKPLEIFNGWAWQIIWSMGGTKLEVYTLQASRCRVSPCGKKVFYCEKWVDDQGKPLTKTKLEEYGYKEFPAFNPNIRTGTQIYFFRVPEQVTEEYGDAYPIPEYCGVIENIVTDIAIREFQRCLAENGMSAQGMLSLFNGMPTEEEKRKIAKVFSKNYTGPNKAGSLIFNYVDPGADSKGAEWTPFQDGNLSDKWELMIKTNQQDIVTGHQVTNKSLVGISVEGALSDRTTIIDSFEQFYNNYIEHRQNLILNEIKMIASLTGVNLDNLEVQRAAPLGVDITNPSIAKYFTEDEIREKLGYQPKEKPAGEVAPVQQGVVNENIQGLTGRDWIHIKRLIREVSNGKTSREAAAMMIRNAYGLNDDDVSVLLGPGSAPLMMAIEKFVNHQEEAIALFEAYAEDENAEDQFVSEEFVEFMGEPSLANRVLDILRGAPDTMPEKVARMLGVESELIITTIDKLVEKGLLTKSAGKLSPTEGGNNRNIPPVETEIYTVYKYSLRDGVPPLKNGRSRPFCSRMMELSRGGKVFTREALNRLTNELGEDAWIYRGGYYNNPRTKETERYCRHVWKAITRSRTKR